MEKFFEKAEEEMLKQMVEAYENEEEYAFVSFDTKKYYVDIEIYVNVVRKVKVFIATKENPSEDKSEKFGLLVEELKKHEPTFDEVMDGVKENYYMSLDETSRIFGSEAGYRRYRYGK